VRFISLFAGIGGFDLGLEMAGMTCVAQVEKNKWCQRVLHKHWPHVPKWEDIYDVRGSELPAAELVVGGFPCQPFSVAGKRQGKRDDRHLWPEFIRIIRETRPTWVLGENVTGIITMALDGVLADLEDAGYSCEAFSIPACGVNAKQKRDRVWIVAHAKSVGVERDRPTGEQVSPVQTRPEILGRYRSGSGAAEWPPEPGVDRVANGVPRRVDRIRGLGNAVVPQVVAVLGEAILQADPCTNIRAGV
jgi:DNA (cytosine-5)-methyltransferase 1